MTGRTCTAPECDREVRARGLCGRHYQQWQRLGYLLDDKSPNYVTVHRELRRARGKASQHVCIDCKEPATDWSYDGSCVEEQTSAEGWPWCIHHEHYSPRCRSCHWTHDARPVPPRMSGESNPRARLSDEDVDDIREAYAEGARQVDLAEQFGVSQSHVSRIIRNAAR